MSNQDTIGKFERQQTKAKELLQKLLNFINQGIALGVKIDPSIKQKLENVIKLINDGGMLKVALIGGFSEGKTSIAAAWLEHLDKNTMNISQRESSNMVNIYDVNGDVEIIDTPGLFGFKEKYNAELKDIEKYKDITKKYISEAHLVLYVMNPTNPIKESHTDDLKWLFRTLNLLPRTVFVLSRFDEVADVEDDWDYYENLKIKKGNVVDRLKMVLNLAPEEAEKLSVVGVAANPFDMGIEYWLKNIEQFRKISKIDTLQKATSDAIDNNGGHFQILFEMEKSVASDIITKQLPEAKILNQQMNDAINVLNNKVADLESDIKITENKILIARTNLISFVKNYIGDLIMQLRGCSMDTIQSIIDAEIGEEGCIFNATIQNKFKIQTKTIDAEIEKVKLIFNAELDQFESVNKKLCSKGLDYMKTSGIVNSKNVLFSRDKIVGLGKLMGMDLSKALKFKPWGAVNFARGLGDILNALGIIIEIFDTYQKMKNEEKFRKAINEMVDELKKTQKSLLELLQNSNFNEEFFPQYVALKDALKAEHGNLELYAQKQKNFKLWYQEGDIIDAEFREL